MRRLLAGACALLVLAAVVGGCRGLEPPRSRAPARRDRAATQRGTGPRRDRRGAAPLRLGRGDRDRGPPHRRGRARRPNSPPTASGSRSPRAACCEANRSRAASTCADCASTPSSAPTASGSRRPSRACSSAGPRSPMPRCRYRCRAPRVDLRAMAKALPALSVEDGELRTHAPSRGSRDPSRAARPLLRADP